MKCIRRHFRLKPMRLIIRDERFQYLVEVLEEMQRREAEWQRVSSVGK